MKNKKCSDFPSIFVVKYLKKSFCCILLNFICDVFKLAALAFVIRKHFGDFLFVVARYAICQNVHRKARLFHIETGGLYASGGVGAGNVKLADVVILNKLNEVVRGQRAAF